MYDGKVLSVGPVGRAVATGNLGVNVCARSFRGRFVSLASVTGCGDSRPGSIVGG